MVLTLSAGHDAHKLTTPEPIRFGSTMQSFKRRRSQKGSELAKKLFCNGYLGLVIVLCALSTALPVDETVRQTAADGCKQTDKARELCLAWHHRATGLGSSRQLQPANEPSKPEPGEPGEPDHGHPEQSDRPDTPGRPDTQTRQT